MSRGPKESTLGPGRFSLGDPRNLPEPREGSPCWELPYTRSTGECLDCGSNWTMNHPAGCDDIPCPACRSLNTVRNWPDGTGPSHPLLEP